MTGAFRMFALGLRRLAVAVALLGSALSAAAFAQPAPGGTVARQPAANLPGSRMLVIDASGSMWNVVGERNSPRRAQLAARFVDKMTMQLAGESTQRSLGMVRLGYQYDWHDQAISREKQCSDVELAVQPGDASQVRDRIGYESGVGRSIAPNDYNPKGRTPLKLAIERAAYAAPAGGATLVVVTDLESDEICLPDPCGPDGQPLASLQALFKARNIRIRYVIAAGLVGAIGERARRFAACFGAEYKVLSNLEEADRLGTLVGRSLIDEAPKPPVTAAALPVSPPPPRGTIAVKLQDPAGQNVQAPGGSVLELRRPDAATPLLKAPGQETAEPGRYESSLSIGSRQWKIGDVEVSADRKTDVTYVISAGILRMQLVDTDYRRIDNEPDTVWEIAGAAGEQSTIRVKGTRLNQALPPGSYHVKIYTDAEIIPRDVKVEAGQETSLEVQVRQR